MMERRLRVKVARIVGWLSIACAAVVALAEEHALEGGALLKNLFENLIWTIAGVLAAVGVVALIVADWWKGSNFEGRDF
jgi:hypothetical protein